LESTPLEFTLWRVFLSTLKRGLQRRGPAEPGIDGGTVDNSTDSNEIAEPSLIAEVESHGFLVTDGAESLPRHASKFRIFRAAGVSARWVRGLARLAEMQSSRTEEFLRPLAFAPTPNYFGHYLSRINVAQRGS
jgi:hypothetical protein